MREIDLKIHYYYCYYYYYMYYHPITLMINQHIRREGGPSVGMQLFFYLMVGVWAEDIPGSVFWWGSNRVRFTKSPEEDNAS